MIRPKPWRVDFEAFGGCYALTGVYVIVAADGATVAVVDVSDYAEQHQVHEENIDARRMAEAIAGMAHT